jgi:hypothetical protein
VRLDRYGDFSPYMLQLVNDAGAAARGTFAVTEVLNGFDPQLAAVTFSFKVECGPAFDCAPASPNCAVPPPAPPPINYLAKDLTRPLDRRAAGLEHHRRADNLCKQSRPMGKRALHFGVECRSRVGLNDHVQSSGLSLSGLCCASGGC